MLKKKSTSDAFLVARDNEVVDQVTNFCVQARVSMTSSHPKALLRSVALALPCLTVISMALSWIANLGHEMTLMHKDDVATSSMCWRLQTPKYRGLRRDES